MIELAISLLCAQDEFPWVKDLETARAAALKEGKPLLVVFR